MTLTYYYSQKPVVSRDISAYHILKSRISGKLRIILYRSLVGAHPSKQNVIFGITGCAVNICLLQLEFKGQRELSFR